MRIVLWLALCFLPFLLPSASYALWTFAVVVAMFFLIALVTWQDAKIQLVLALCSFSVWKVWEAPKRIKKVEYGRILEGCDFLLLEHFFSQASGLSESPFEKKFFFSPARWKRARGVVVYLHTWKQCEFQVPGNWSSFLLGFGCWLILAQHFLVGGLEHFLFFHILGIIIPTDELIFFRGVGIPPTSFGRGFWKISRECLRFWWKFDPLLQCCDHFGEVAQNFFSKTTAGTGLIDYF